MFPKLLRRDILLVLGIKAAALALIYVAFVAPHMGPDPDRTAMRTHLLGEPTR